MLEHTTIAHTELSIRYTTPDIVVEINDMSATDAMIPEM